MAIYKYLIFVDCDICGKSVSKQALKRHIFSHYSHLPTKFCEVCYSPCTTKFCSRRCSATKSNAIRKDSGWKPSEESNERRRRSLYANPLLRQRICKVSFCQECGTTIPNKIKVTCSQLCMKARVSKKMKGKMSLQQNRGRHKKSWLEIGMESFLNERNITYETEKRFHNIETRKNYFCDFFIPSHSLIIEMDGTQHKKTILADEERDRYLLEHEGYYVLRITHAQWKGKEKHEILNVIFGVPEGSRTPLLHVESIVS